jgi:hypothetical protein
MMTWEDTVKGKITVKNLPKKVKKIIKKLGYYYVGFDKQRKHTRHYFKLDEKSPYVLWIDTSGSPSRGENILAKIRADIRRTAAGRGRGSGSMKDDDVSTSMDIYDKSNSLLKEENFNKFIKESTEFFIDYFKQHILSSANPSIVAQWKQEQWAILEEEAISMAMDFIQNVALEGKKYSHEFLNKSDIQKAIGVKYKVAKQIHKHMSDGKWRTATEIINELNLDVTGTAVAHYCKAVTSMYSQSGGATLYERRKRPVERKKHGRSSIWEFKMRTEKIHKAKVIGSPKTDIKIKKIPKKKKNKSCVELYKQAVEEIKDYLITFKSDMVRYSAGDYRYVEVIEEDNLADFPNMFFNYDTMIGGVKTGFIRYGPYYRDSMTEEKACALLEARGKVVARDMKSDPDKPVWTIQSGVIGGGNNMGAVKLKDGNHHHSWFFQFWYGGPHTKSYQTKGELVMIEIMNIVDDILEKYNNMR